MKTSGDEGKDKSLGTRTGSGDTKADNYGANVIPDLREKGGSVHGAIHINTDNNSAPTVRVQRIKKSSVRKICGSEAFSLTIV